jgi:hypothetical protein
VAVCAFGLQHVWAAARQCFAGLQNSKIGIKNNKYCGRGDRAKERKMTIKFTVSDLALKPIILAIGLANAAIAAPVLEEVVVTAQKRTESLQDVPVAVSALSADDLQEAYLRNKLAIPPTNEKYYTSIERHNQSSN